MKKRLGICPLMSTASEANSTVPKVAFCLGRECQFWISRHTTEIVKVEGCCIALAPQMENGQFRV